MVDAGTYVCRASDQQITSFKVNILNSESSPANMPSPVLFKNCLNLDVDE